MKIGVILPVGEGVGEDEPLPYSYLDPDKALRGTPDEIADGLLAYAGLGVDHLICNLIPSTAETLSELTRALRLLRG